VFRFGGRSHVERISTAIAFCCGFSGRSLFKCLDLVAIAFREIVVRSLFDVNLNLVGDRLIIQGYNDPKTGSFMLTMQTHSRPQVSNQSVSHLVKDMTVEQLQTLIQITVEELLVEFLGDPDQGLELKVGIQEQLLEQRKQIKKQRGLSTTEVLQVLELD
jgi:hypothetical protein